MVHLAVQAPARPCLAGAAPSLGQARTLLRVQLVVPHRTRCVRHECLAVRWSLIGARHACGGRIHRWRLVDTGSSAAPLLTELLLSPLLGRAPPRLWWKRGES